MKKNLIVSFFIILILSWCVKQNNVIETGLQDKKLQDKISCNKFFTIWSWQKQVYVLQAKVVSSNIKNVLSPNAGIVSYLNCVPWKKVSSKTLIAKIIPDWSDPNVKALETQKQYLLDQIKNTENIIDSTKLNFSEQLNSLVIQKKNLENQINILKNNLVELKKQKKYGLWDLEQQLKSLKQQLEDLEKSKNKLESLKKSDINKLKDSISTTRNSAESLIKTVFLRIDEIFGITNKNKHKNDAFEQYLCAKDVSLKEKIKWDFTRLYSKVLKLDSYSNTDFTEYVYQVDNLVQEVKDWIKNSVSTYVLPQTLLNSWYNEFLNYDNSLIQLKGNLDNLVKSLKIVKDNYDNQIIQVETSINSIKNNISNLEKNKINSYLSNIQIQINQIKSQLQSDQTNLKNVITNIENLKNQENIQLNQLENQLVGLKNSLSNLNIKLSPNYVYAGVNWKIKFKNVSKWNKVWPNSLLCQIVPNKTSLKLQIYWDINNKPDYVQFNYWNQICVLRVISKLPYKDPVTQNNIYETENFATCNRKKVDLSSIFQEWQTLSVNYVLSGKYENKIKIPLNFVVNEIDGQYIYKVSGLWKYKKAEIKLWNIDGEDVEVLSWLKIGDKICR